MVTDRDLNILKKIQKKIHKFARISGTVRDGAQRIKFGDHIFCQHHSKTFFNFF